MESDRRPSAEPSNAIFTSHGVKSNESSQRGDKLVAKNGTTADL
jgi:uncharacterized protein YegP (UPF0339 family)